MSDLIQRFTGRTLNEWDQWYLEQKPDAIRDATERILEMLPVMRTAMDRIDRELVEKWVRDLVIVKTFIGLRFQEVVLKRGAELKGVDFRLATPEEEAMGVDGFIGDTPVSIKPSSYKAKSGLQEEIEVGIVYYEKKKDGIIVDYGDIL